MRNCSGCNSRFTVWRRKHHCRVCGYVFCSGCCPKARGTRVCCLCKRSRPRKTEVDTREQYEYATQGETASELHAVAKGLLANRDKYTPIVGIKVTQRPVIATDFLSQHATSPVSSPTEAALRRDFNQRSIREKHDAALIAAATETVLHDGASLSPDDTLHVVLALLRGPLVPLLHLLSTDLSAWTSHMSLPSEGTPPHISVMYGLLLHTRKSSRALASPTQGPRLLLLQSPLDFFAHREDLEVDAPPQHLESLSALVSQEQQFMDSILGRIRWLSPDVILSTAHIAGLLRRPLEEEGVRILQGVDAGQLHAIARSSGGTVLRLLDLVQNRCSTSDLGWMTSYSLLSFPFNRSYAFLELTLQDAQTRRIQPHITFLHSGAQAETHASLMSRLFTLAFDLHCRESLLYDQYATYSSSPLPAPARCSFTFIRFNALDDNSRRCLTTSHPSIDLYTAQDRSLSGYLMTHFLGREAERNCAHCPAAVQEHTQIVSSEQGRVTLECQMLPVPLEKQGQHLLMWSRCRRCGSTVTPVQRMQQHTALLSFHSYLVTCFNQSTACYSRRCSHSISCSHVSYFGYNDRVVSLQFEPQQCHTVSHIQPQSSLTLEFYMQAIRTVLQQLAMDSERESPLYVLQCAHQAHRFLQQKLQGHTRMRRSESAPALGVYPQHAAARAKDAESTPHVAFYSRLLFELEHLEPTLAFDWPDTTSEATLSTVPSSLQCTASLIASMLSAIPSPDTAYPCDSIEHTWTVSSVPVSVTALCAAGFASLRRHSFAPPDWIHSLRLAYPMDPGGSRSSASFFRSHDNRLILKSLSEREAKMFYSGASKYLEHVEATLVKGMPSILVPILGVYRVSTPATTTHWSVMPNLFYGQNVLHVFDLKGKRARRATQDPDAGMMDHEFIQFTHGVPLYIDAAARSFLSAALDRDTAFLAQNSIMDYSFLMGVDSTHIVVGLVDYVRQYTLDKKLETQWKSVLFPDEDPTILPPEKYRSRFLHQLQMYVHPHAALDPGPWASPPQ